MVELSQNHDKKCNDLELIRDFHDHNYDDNFLKSKKMISSAIKVYKCDQWSKWALAC